MDTLKTQVANLADLLDRQLALLVDTKFNNEVKNLASEQHFEKHSKTINQLKALEQTKIAMIKELKDKTGLSVREITSLLRSNDIGEVLHSARKLK